MKLFFDQNLSYKLVQRLTDIFPESEHVRSSSLEAASDPVIWEYAKNNDLMIVSKDSDFHQRSFLFGFPPKVIWIRLGNCSTDDIERILRVNYEAIQNFYEDQDAAFFSLST